MAVNFPGAHGAHVPSARGAVPGVQLDGCGGAAGGLEGVVAQEVEPALGARVPGGHGVHWLESGVTEKASGGQSAQVRFPEASLLLEVPGGQAGDGGGIAQAVEPALGARVPGGHGMHWLESGVAEKVSGGQSAQVRFPQEDPTKVPGGHILGRVSLASKVLAAKRSAKGPEAFIGTPLGYRVLLSIV